ncbi:MAG: PTS fructose transporter subunit IIA [Desulfuromonas sp.]|nr:MAG: PTS fructose transporter subunit IIA [Desulfuromonas sp.]
MSVKISELLAPEAVMPEMSATLKDDALSELTDALLDSGCDLDRDEVLRILQERENLGSTGIGEGVAIPHGKLKNLDRLVMSFGRSRNGVDFDSMDGKPAHLFFLLIAPEESVGIHLKTLARISKLLKDQEVRQQLLEASDREAICAIISAEESNL